MIVTVVDVETTKKPDFHPWQEGARLVMVGIRRITPTSDTYNEWIVGHNEIGPATRHNTWSAKPIEHGDSDRCIEEMTLQLSDSDICVGHNVKFDINWLRHAGVKVDHLRLWDTMISEFMMYGQRKDVALGLGATCTRWGLPTKLDKVKTYWDAGVDTPDIPLATLSEYLESDVNITALLFKEQWIKLNSRKNLHTLVRVRSDCCNILSKIEINGMMMDIPQAESIYEDFFVQLGALDDRLCKLFKHTINISSGQELSAALYGGMLKWKTDEPCVKERWATLKEPYEFTYKSGKHKGLTITKYKNRRVREIFGGKHKVDHECTLKGVGFYPVDKSELAGGSGYYRTGKNVIKQLVANSKGGTTRKTKQEVKKLLLLRKKINRLVTSLRGKKETSGLLNKVGLDHKVHPQYTNTVAATGRMSSIDPNGQNFSRSKKDPDGFTNPLKTIFIPSNGGWIVVVDLSQLEWRVAAWLSQDPVAIAEILAGHDIHADNAIIFFGDIKWRQEAKIMSFRLLYGGSAYAFYMDPLMPDFSLKKWNEIVTQYENKYWVLTAWQQSNIRDVGVQNGWYFSPLGRIYSIPQVVDGKWAGVMKYSETCIKNYPIQGLATGDIVPIAMNNIDHQLFVRRSQFTNCRWYGQVHDAVIFDVDSRDDVAPLSKICIDVYEDLPRLVSKMFNVNFDIPLTGEAEAGRNYGNLPWKLKKENGLWVTKGEL